MINSNKTLTETHTALRYMSHIYAPKKCVHTHMHTHIHIKGLHYTAQLNMSHQYDRPSETQRGHELERRGVESKRQKKIKEQCRARERGRENVIE